MVTSGASGAIALAGGACVAGTDPELMQVPPTSLPSSHLLASFPLLRSAPLFTPLSSPPPLLSPPFSSSLLLLPLTLPVCVAWTDPEFVQAIPDLSAAPRDEFLVRHPAGHSTKDLPLPFHCLSLTFH